MPASLGLGRTHASVFYGHQPLRKIFDAQRIAEGVRQLFELENLFRVWFFVNAVQRAEPAALEVARDRLVGGQHELFDQPVRDVAFAADDANHLSRGVEFDHRSGQIEINRAKPRAPRIEDHREVPHRSKFFGKVGIFRSGGRVALQYGIDGRVRHALGRANHAARKFRCDDFPVRVQLHNRAYHQAVFMRLKRADAVR